MTSPLRSQGSIPPFDITFVPVRQPNMADNEVVEPAPNQGMDPTLGDPIGNGNDVLEGEEQEQEIEQEIESEEIEREDEFEDSLEELPNGGEGDRQVRDRKQPLPIPPPPGQRLNFLTFQSPHSPLNKRRMLQSSSTS